VAIGRAANAEAAGPANVLFHVLLVLAVVAVAGRLLGRLLARIRQPPVIGEVVAGIVLGPSFLGRLAPDVAAYVLPPSIAPSLNVVAQLGIVVYMFLIGVELNVDRLRRHTRATVATSHASIVAPFVLGSALALYLYPRLSTSSVPFTSFALFMSVAMSITAFPVLARILSDRRMASTELGTIALTCAAVDDVTAWCLLAFVTGVARATLGGAAVVAALTAGFIAIMILLVRPVAARFAIASGARPVQETLAIVLTGMLLSALATELIGIHAIFGAFLFGAVIPHDSALARTLTDRMKDLVTILLLPAFFALAGMRTRIDLLTSASEWLICGLIILVATAGKFGGTLAAARIAGMNFRDAASLGILMNTRGLMELIVLNIGLDLGVISPALFTMMVLMALATTVATTPLLDLLVPGVVRYNRRGTE
jgi:Kef-type K+ transport system membrane component KefB